MGSKQSSKFNADNFLNRLALDEMTDPFSLDPYLVLKAVFDFYEPGELQQMFTQFCAASMTEEYSWNLGSPGDIVFLCEKIEQIVEACYLICQTKKKKLRKKLHNNYKVIESYQLPILLSANEYERPAMVIEEFFKYQPLQKWKLALHIWMEAALSNHSVVESIEPPELLPFIDYMRKLFEASSLVVIVLDRENSVG
jgi:hypothetical protein